MSRKRNAAFLLSLATVTILFGARRIEALDIVIDYEGAQSHEPSDDSDGSQLTAIVEAAATVWETIIQDSHTITIRVWWDESSSFDDAEDIAAAGHNIIFPATPPRNARIRFNNAHTYFYDSTPNDDSEFEMKGTVYESSTPYLQDLPADYEVGGGTDAYYRGSPPDVLEAGYGGHAPIDSVAVGKYDLFSIALHELGHAIGMAQPLNGVSQETNPDDDYDINPFHLGSPTTTMAVVTSYDNESEDYDHSHVNAVITDPDDPNKPEHFALMAPNADIDIRRRPSATDVLPIARAMGWTQVNLKRKYLVDDGSGFPDWGVAANWVGGMSPSATSGSSAFIVEPTITDVRYVNASVVHDLLQTTASMQLQNSLMITGEGIVSGAATQLLANAPGGQVLSNGNGTLDINDGALLEIGVSNSVSDLNRLTINETTPPGSSYDEAVIRHFGTISMAGSSPAIIIRDGGLELNPGGASTPLIDGTPYDVTILSDGYLQGGGDVLNVRSLNNLGRIEAIQTTLHIADDVAGTSLPFDLDGDINLTSTELRAVDADLWFEGKYEGEFHGQATVGPHRTMSFDVSRAGGGGVFRIGDEGKVTLIGGTTDADTAILAGRKLALGGTGLYAGIVDVTGYGALHAPGGISTSGDAKISVANGGTLVLAGPITYCGLSSFAGEGQGIQEGDANVTVDTHIGLLEAGYDWDGSRDMANTTVQPGVTLSINVSRIEATAMDGFDGEISLLEASRLTVATTAGQWLLEGRMMMDNAEVDGDDLLNSGDLSGTGTIDADVTNSGLLSPGFSVGSLTIIGNLRATSAAELDIEIGGVDAGMFDKIYVNNNSTIDGVLNVSFVDGFLPSPGESWTIIDVNLGATTGMFTGLSEGAIVGTYGGTNLSISYNVGGNDVVLLASAVLTGDFDGDGDVDGSDFLALQRDPSVGSLADWKTNFGSSPSTALSDAVPEPTSSVLLTVAVAACLWRIRKLSWLTHKILEPLIS